MRHIRVLLLVEDSQRLRTVLKVYLQPIVRARVVTAADAGSALAQAHQWQPEVMLVDLNLPDLAGVAAIRELKSIRPRAAIVAMASEPEPEHYLAATRAGADVFIAKEALGIQLEPAVREAFRAAEARERAARRQAISQLLNQLRSTGNDWLEWSVSSLRWLDTHGPWPGRPQVRLLYAIDLAGTLFLAFHHLPTG
jgi:DNA-binding NarL/FixJ family response regulator